MELVGRRFEVLGRVQGVGFRYFVRGEASRLGVRGWVRNRADGSVECVAAGTEAQLVALEESIRSGPGPSRVDMVRVSEASEAAADPESFKIVY